MGVSTDAKLVYGIQIEEDSDEAEICRSLMNDRYTDLRDAEREFDGVTITYHCSDECPMYIIGVNEYVANRGYPKEVDPKMFTLDQEEAARDIRHFCEKFNIPFSEDDCHWWLCSWWG